MKFNKKELLASLQKKVLSHIAYINSLKTIPSKDLNYRTSEESWSILECIEHLNLYAVFYNDEISSRLSKAPNSNIDTFKSGYLGNRSAESMLPKQELNAMKTFKSKNPIHSNLKREKVLTSFITYQEELVDLLEKSKEKDITKIKTKLTIPLLKV